MRIVPCVADGADSLRVPATLAGGRADEHEVEAAEGMLDMRQCRMSGGTGGGRGSVQAEMA